MQITTTEIANQAHFLDKKESADTIIKRYTLIAAGTGFIPIPFVDAIAMTGVQFTMIRQLSLLYETPFKAHRVKAISAAFMGSIGTVSGFKFIPKIGTVIGGLSSSTVGAASTYAIGKVFTQHFDQGGTLLDFNPIASRTHFEQELKKGKEIFVQLREEAILKTPEGQRQAIHQLNIDSDQYLTILAALQVKIAQYKVDQDAKPSTTVNLLDSTLAENNAQIEDVTATENSVKIEEVVIIEKLSWWIRLKHWLIKPSNVDTPLQSAIAENSLDTEQVATTTIEKLNWWVRLKHWLMQRKR